MKYTYMGFKKDYNGYTSYNSNKGYGKSNYTGKRATSYRVKSPIKSFRDLEVYKNTTILSSEIYKLKFPKKLTLEEEVILLKNISKNIPRLIAESYGDKWDNFKLGMEKLESAMRHITNIIAKIDFILVYTDGEEENKELYDSLVNMAKRYSTQRTKILNLKKAWIKTFEKYNK